MRFAFEASHPVGVERQRARMHFDDDVALQTGVRAVDLSHAAGAERREVSHGPSLSRVENGV